MEKKRSGNPNPKTDHLEATQFQKGESGNPGGKTSEQRRLEIENGERATRVRHKILGDLEKFLDAKQAQAALSEQVDGVDADSVPIGFKMMTAEVLRMLNDAERRGFGEPEQAVALTGPDGKPIQTITRQMTPQEAAEAYAATLDSDKG